MSALPDELTIASRGSHLALLQAEIVAGLVRRAHPRLRVEITTAATTGDRDVRPFRAIGGKGLFTSEVERVVVEGRADVAVHSAKDLTAELASGCVIVSVPARSSPGDVVVGGDGDSGEQRLGSLPRGATIGTSSMRRRVLIEEARPDLAVVDLRGNLDTRLEKVHDGDVAAAVLAAAGIERLGRGELAATGGLDPGWWVPAPAQGALAVEGLVERADIAALFAPLGDRGATAEVACERSFAARLEGGCSVPLGCLARADAELLVATGFLGSPGGGRSLRDRISGRVDDAAALGAELADAILGAGGDEILAEVRETALPQPGPP
jgi:hydroxymethylbilane synthase